MSKSTADHLRVIEGGETGLDFGVGGDTTPGGVAPSNPPPDPLVGRTIDGRYFIEEVLGEGGMGLVYAARHSILGKRLAIKVLRPEVSKDEEIITRFRQEAQSASAIGNEHIIDISDFGTLPDSSTYFVMEFLDGKDLTTAIEEQRPMEDVRVVHIAKQLCQALGAAHSRGIVHRDLKPDNIYLIRRHGDPDFVKVLDFGIAKVGSGTKKLTKAGQVFGTPHYMSPEQCAGTGTDHRTDIYAMGVILYEMTAGKVPFDADNLMGILTKHMYEQPVPPHTLPPPVDVSPPLEAVILRCLEKSPESRYQTMEAVLEDLRKVEQGITPDAVLHAVDRSSGPGRTDPTGAHRGMAVRVGEPEGIPSRFPRPLLFGGAALAAIGIAAAVLAVAMSGEEEQPAPPVVTPPVMAEAPVEEQPEQPQMEESGSTETEKVTISSTPEGVEVWSGDELLGNTPVEIPRPEGEARAELTLRMAGYRDQPVRISALTAESVRITLEQEREEPQPRDRVRRAGRSRRDRDRPRERATMAVETSPAVMETPMVEPPPPQPTPMATPMRTLPQSEVIDPWG